MVASAVIDRAAMRKVTTVQQIESHHSVALVDEGLIYRRIGNSAGKWLDIEIKVVRRKPGRAQQLGTAPACKGLDNVGVFNSLVVAPIGVASIVSQLTDRMRLVALCPENVPETPSMSRFTGVAGK